MRVAVRVRIHDALLARRVGGGFETVDVVGVVDVPRRGIDDVEDGRGETDDDGEVGGGGDEVVQGLVEGGEEGEGLARVGFERVEVGGEGLEEEPDLEGQGGDLGVEEGSDGGKLEDGAGHAGAELGAMETWVCLSVSLLFSSHLDPLNNFSSPSDLHLKRDKSTQQ